MLAAAGVSVGVFGLGRLAGLGSAARDLLQFRTRDDLSEYGSHWHSTG
jgi:hypothetical protein